MILFFVFIANENGKLLDKFLLFSNEKQRNGVLCSLPMKKSSIDWGLEYIVK
jgi:hypothetical protein